MPTPTTSVRTAVAAFAALALFAGCGSDSGSAEIDEADIDAAEENVSAAASDLVGVLEENGLESASSFVRDIDVSEIVGSDEYTFLAPGDDAFIALSAEEVAEVMSDEAALTALLKNHLIDQRLDASELAELESVTTLSGMELEIVSDDDGLTVGGARIQQSDLVTDSAVVHVVDRIFLP